MCNCAYKNYMPFLCISKCKSKYKVSKTPQARVRDSTKRPKIDAFSV